MRQTRCASFSYHLTTPAPVVLCHPSFRTDMAFITPTPPNPLFCPFFPPLSPLSQEYITKPWNTSRLLQSSTPPIRHRLSESMYGHSISFSFPCRCFIFFGRILRREPELTQFETAQIANLCPADAEEAKSIIPRYALRNMVPLDPDSHLFFLPPLVSLKSKTIDFRLYWTRFRLCGSSRHETSWTPLGSLLKCHLLGTALW